MSGLIKRVIDALKQETRTDLEPAEKPSTSHRLLPADTPTASDGNDRINDLPGPQ